MRCYRAYYDVIVMLEREANNRCNDGESDILFDHESSRMVDPVLERCV